MPESTEQSYENHVRRLPLPFVLVSSALGLNIVVATALLIMRPSLQAAWMLIVALALAGLSWYVRFNSLVVQDRVIRLEEQLRLERLLPDDLRARAAGFSLDQLVALRFAADDELPDLARQVVDENLTDRAEIKRRIRSWRADLHRV
jgi:hypothetical protein